MGSHRWYPWQWWHLEHASKNNHKQFETTQQYIHDSFSTELCCDLLVQGYGWSRKLEDGLGNGRCWRDDPAYREDLSYLTGPLSCRDFLVPRKGRSVALRCLSLCLDRRLLYLPMLARFPSRPLSRPNSPWLWSPQGRRRVACLWRKLSCSRCRHPGSQHLSGCYIKEQVHFDVFVFAHLGQVQRRQGFLLHELDLMTFQGFLYHFHHPVDLRDSQSTHFC